MGVSGARIEASASVGTLGNSRRSVTPTLQTVPAWRPTTASPWTSTTPPASGEGKWYSPLRPTCSGLVRSVSSEAKRLKMGEKSETGGWESKQ